MQLATECLVRIEGGDGRFLGSGFAAGGRSVITCAHVAAGAVGEIVVRRADGSRDIVTAVRMIPDDPGDAATWPAPDLARLIVASADRPSVWLGCGTPEPMSAALAIGYTEETWADGPALHTVSLHVAGASGPPLLKVGNDYVPGGMSGSPVLNLEDGRVCGVVKAAATAGPGGWIVPTAEIFRHFPELEAFSDPERWRGSPWWDAATHRVVLTERIFGPAGPTGAWPAPEEPSPSWWLDPRLQVVEYRPGPEFELLLSWARGDDRDAHLVKLLHGSGGAGKTRLALEIARRLDREGWIAGVLPPDSAEFLLPVAEAVAEAVRWGHRIFLAVDYVEGYGRQVSSLIERLPRGSVRILLLARSAGAWWRNFALSGRISPLIDRTPVVIDPTAFGSHAHFTAALTEFRQRMSGATDPPPASDGLQEQARRHHDVLSVHALALNAAIHESQHGTLPTGAELWPAPLRQLAGHERQHLITTGARLGIRPDQDFVGQAIVTPSLVAARSEAQAIAALDCLPAAVGDSRRLAGLLRDLYPPPPRGMRWWSALPLDRLTETLIEETVADSTGAYLQRLIEPMSIWLAAEALVPLARIIANPTTPVTKEIGRCVDALARDREFRLLPALHEAEKRAFGTAQLSVACLDTLDPATIARLVQQIQQTGREGLLDFAALLLDRMADDTQMAVEGESRAFTAGIPSEIRKKIGLSNNGTVLVRLLRAQILARLGRYTEALGHAEHVVQQWRRAVDHRIEVGAGPTDVVMRVYGNFDTIVVSRTHGEIAPALIVALDTYAGALSGVGRHQQSVAALADAVARSRALATDDPANARYLPYYLHRLAAAHRDAGDHQTADQTAAEAFRLTEPAGRHLATETMTELAEAAENSEPDDDPDRLLIAAVQRQGAEIIAAQRSGVPSGELRDAAEGWLSHLRALAADDPESFTHVLARALTWAAANWPEESASLLTEAIDVLRRRPGQPVPASLSTLGLALSAYTLRCGQDGRHDEAQVAAADAVGIFDQLAQEEPAQKYYLFTSLALLSEAARLAGDTETALVAARRVANMPDRYTADAPSSSYVPGDHERRLAELLLIVAVEVKDSKRVVALTDEVLQVTADHTDARLPQLACLLQAATLIEHRHHVAAVRPLVALLPAPSGTLADQDLLGWVRRILDEAGEELSAEQNVALLSGMLGQLVLMPGDHDTERWFGAVLSTLTVVVSDHGLPAAAASALAEGLVRAISAHRRLFKPAHIGLLQVPVSAMQDDAIESMIEPLLAVVEGWTPDERRDSWVMYVPILTHMGDHLVSRGRSDQALAVLELAVRELRPHVTSWREDPADLFTVAMNSLLNAASATGRSLYNVIREHLSDDASRVHVLVARADKFLRLARAEDDRITADALSAYALGMTYSAGDIDRIAQGHKDHAAILARADPFDPNAMAHHLASVAIAALLRGRVEIHELCSVLVIQLGWRCATTVDEVGHRVSNVPYVAFEHLIELLGGVARGQGALDAILTGCADQMGTALREGARHRTHFEPVIAAIVAARKRGDNGAAWIREVLQQYAAIPTWRGLAKGLLRLLDGRDDEAMDAANDDVDRALIARCKYAIRDVINVPAQAALALGVGGSLSTMLFALQHPDEPQQEVKEVQRTIARIPYWAPLAPVVEELLRGQRQVEPDGPPHVRAAVRLLLDGAAYPRSLPYTNRSHEDA